MTINYFFFVTIISLMNSFYLLLMIELKWEEPKEDELRKFLVERMGFNPDRVTTGIAKLQTAHRKKSQKRMDRYFNLFYFIFLLISLNFILFYSTLPFFLFFIFILSFLIASFVYHFLLLIWHKILKVYLLTKFHFFSHRIFFLFSFFPFFHFSIFNLYS